MRSSRFAGAAFCVAALAAVMTLYIAQALVTATLPFDEPLWFMRSQASPADFSTRDYREWAIDAPAVNRWIYHYVLKGTGLDAVGEGEPRAWHVENGRLYFGIRALPDGVAPQVGTPEALAEWERVHGTYAPRAAIIALRMADLAGYAALLAALWWTGWVVLQSPYLATLAVLPMTVIPLFGMRVAFASASGDIFCMALMAAALAVWTYAHVRAGATAGLPLAVVAALLGLAAASKLIAILALVAYLAYLVIYSRGWRRLVNPIAAGAVSFVVFAMLDPIVFIDPFNPFRMCLMMVEWRLGLVTGYVSANGPMTWTEFCEQALFWWPMTPAIAYVAWRSRSKPWFAPVALWAAALFFGTIMQLAHTRMMSPHYLAPLELGLYFPFALMLIAAAKDARAAQ